MALDDGTGRPVYPTLPTQTGNADVDVDETELKTFKKEVDELLTKLEESEAAPKKVGGVRMVQSHLGTAALRESEYLYGTYQVVHDELENLSKMLAMQIEGLSVGLDASRKGYENMNEDVRSRMLLLAKEAGTEYDEPAAQQSGVREQGGAQGRPSGNGNGTGDQPGPGAKTGQI
ncbi:hypothetical protein AB0O07_23085 [Streptomyces sp. NPDC093085]|uniref:hypothetical protein n=1 Tax=Streptomyces sp. NPDC093085 TaxID=3155068 RepID=UPI003431CD1C